MELLTLDVYSGRDLQNVRAVLHQALAGGASIAALATQIEQELGRRGQVNQAVASVPVSYPRPLCPGCGMEMVPVANTEGLSILGCKKCRYSRVEGES